jgi:hypothetical protein
MVVVVPMVEETKTMQPLTGRGWMVRDVPGHGMIGVMSRLEILMS